MSPNSHTTGHSPDLEGRNTLERCLIEAVRPLRIGRVDPSASGLQQASGATSGANSGGGGCAENKPSSAKAPTPPLLTPTAHRPAAPSPRGPLSPGPHGLLIPGLDGSGGPAASSGGAGGDVSWNTFSSAPQAQAQTAGALSSSGQADGRQRGWSWSTSDPGNASPSAHKSSSNPFMDGWDELGLGSSAAGVASMRGAQQQQQQQTGLNGKRQDGRSSPAAVLVDLGFDDPGPAPAAAGVGGVGEAARNGAARIADVSALGATASFRGGGVERTSRSVEPPQQDRRHSMQPSLGGPQQRRPPQSVGGIERATSMGHPKPNEWNGLSSSSAAAAPSAVPGGRSDFGMRTATPPLGQQNPFGTGASPPPPPQLSESVSYGHNPPRNPAAGRGPPPPPPPPPPVPDAFLGFSGPPQGVAHHHHPPPPPPPPPPPTPPFQQQRRQHQHQLQQQQWSNPASTLAQRVGPQATTQAGGGFRHNSIAPQQQQQQQQQLGAGSGGAGRTSNPVASSGMTWAQMAAGGGSSGAAATAQQHQVQRTVVKPAQQALGGGGGGSGGMFDGMPLMPPQHLRSTSDTPRAGVNGGGVFGSVSDTQEHDRQRSGRPTVAEERLRRRRLEGLEQQQQLHQHQEQEKLLQQFWAMGGGGDWDEEAAARAAESAASGASGAGAGARALAGDVVRPGLSRRSCSGGALSALSGFPRPLSPSSTSAQGRASPTSSFGGAKLSAAGRGGGVGVGAGGGLPLSPTSSVHSGFGAGGNGGGGGAISPVSSLSNSPASSPFRRVDALSRRSQTPPPSNGYGHHFGAAGGSSSVSLGVGRLSPGSPSPPRRATASFAGVGGVRPRKRTPPRPERAPGGGRSESVPARPRSWTGSRSANAALAAEVAAAAAEAAARGAGARPSTNASQLGILLPLDYSGCVDF